MIYDLRRYMDAVQTLVEAQPNKKWEAELQRPSRWASLSLSVSSYLLPDG